MLTDTLLRDAVAALPGAAATAVVWRSRGRLHVTVIVKATFAFAQGADMQRVAPQEILRDEVHHGKNPGRSVQFTSDLVPYLGRCDVLFTGHAYPEPGAAGTTAARLGVFRGDQALLDKTVAVRAGAERVPLDYEHAFGGMSVPDNPLGSAEPTVVDPTDPRRPAGFGPIARAWPARKQLLKATPRKVLEGAVAEIPDDLDWGYFQAAPADQRIGFLAGDEWIVMAGLLATEARAQMRLPGARGAARIHGLTALGWSEGHPLALVADVLRIDGEERRCTVVWRGNFAVPGKAELEAVRIVAGVEIAGQPLAWPASFDALRRDSGARAPDGRADPTATAALGEPRTSFLVSEAPPDATPFVASVAPDAVARSAGAAVRGPGTGTLALGESAASATLAIGDDEILEASPAPAVPFQPSSAPSPLATPGPVARREATGTLALSPDEDEPVPEARSVPTPAEVDPPGVAASWAQPPAALTPVVEPPPQRVPDLSRPPEARPGHAGVPAIVARAAPAGAMTFGAHFLAAMDAGRE